MTTFSRNGSVLNQIQVEDYFFVFGVEGFSSIASRYMLQNGDHMVLVSSHEKFNLNKLPQSESQSVENLITWNNPIKIIFLGCSQRIAEDVTTFLIKINKI